MSCLDYVHSLLVGLQIFIFTPQSITTQPSECEADYLFSYYKNILGFS